MAEILGGGRRPFASAAARNDHRRRKHGANGRSGTRGPTKLINTTRERDGRNKRSKEEFIRVR